MSKKRNYYIETVESQYIHAHHQQDINIVRKVFKKNHNYILIHLINI